MTNLNRLSRSSLVPEYSNKINRTCICLYENLTGSNLPPYQTIVRKYQVQMKWNLMTGWTDL